MIDINELRRLAQAASHPTTKGRWIRLFGERTVYDRMEDGCRGIPVVSTDKHPPSSFEAACLDFIAAANPVAVSELLDRLEAAEAEALEEARLNGMGSEREAKHLAQIAALEKERDAMRAQLDTISTKVHVEYCAYSKDWRESDTAGRIDWLIAMYESVKEDRDALSAELDELKGQRGEVVYRWLALDYSGFCYGSSPPDNLPNHCNLKAFYAPAEVAP